MRCKADDMRMPQRRSRLARLVFARLRRGLRSLVGARQRARHRDGPAGIGCGKPDRGQSAFYKKHGYRRHRPPPRRPYLLYLPHLPLFSLFAK